MQRRCRLTYVQVHYESIMRTINYNNLSLATTVYSLMLKSRPLRIENKEVDVEIMTLPDEPCRDHVQFLVTDKTPTCADVRRGSNCPAAALELLSYEPRISPDTFCRAFPFHVMFGRDMKIVQAGAAIARVVSELQDESFTFPDLFSVVRPSIDVAFDAIVARANTVFVVRVRDRTAVSSRAESFPPLGGRCRSSSTSEDREVFGGRQIRLRGEMRYVQETDVILFLCSPSVAGLQELLHSGLSLADIPIHDSTRDLLLLSEQFRAEYELTQRLQVSAMDGVRV